MLPYTATAIAGVSGIPRSAKMQTMPTTKKARNSKAARRLVRFTKNVRKPSPSLRYFDFFVHDPVGKFPIFLLNVLDGCIANAVWHVLCQRSLGHARHGFVEL